jgi:hypothetical protein
MINGLKRRGASAQENTVINQTVVQLVLPTAITTKFIANSANQVISAGDQTLITIGSSQLMEKLS